MARTVVADDSLQDKLTALAKAGRFQIGLLIGQNAKDRDIIVHLAPTPVPDEGDLSSEDEEPLPNTKAEQARAKYPESIPKVLDSVVAQHARQVVRMLPGGLDIIGIYVVTPQADFTASVSQSKLRSVLGSVHKTASRILLETSELRSEKVILHVCTQTFKVVCKTQDISPTDVSAQTNADIKFHRSGTRWQQLSYTYNVNLNFWLPKEKNAQSLYKTILTLLRPWAQSVAESLILIDSELPDDDDSLDSSSDDKTPSRKKGGGGRGVMDLAPPKVFTAEILDSCAPLTTVTSGISERTGCARLTGCLAGLAFVHAKATFGEGRRAVITDLVRSVVGRWEMHCDSLVEEPPSNIGPIIHEPPRRVFLEGGGLPVSLCDYLFPGDTPADACQSAKELLSLRIHEEHVDDTQETLADPSDVMDGTDDPDNGCEAAGGSEGHGRGTGGACSITHILLGAAVAVIGIGISYVTLTTGSKAIT